MNNTVKRTFDILELVGKSENGITLQEISNELKIAKSSAFVVVHSLLELKHLSTLENNDKKYVLGIKSFTLGMKYTKNLDFVQLCANYLPNIAEKYNKTAFVGILNDYNIIYLYKYVAKNARLATCAIGSTKPAYATALGKAILAFLSKEQQLNIIEKIEFNALTSQTINSKTAFLNELNITKERGFSIEKQELETLTLCYGAPIFNHEKKVIAAISLSDLNINTNNEEEISNDLKNIALKISKMLGYSN